MGKTKPLGTAFREEVQGVGQMRKIEDNMSRVNRDIEELLIISKDLMTKLETVQTKIREKKE